MFGQNRVDLLLHLSRVKARGSCNDHIGIGADELLIRNGIGGTPCKQERERAGDAGYCSSNSRTNHSSSFRIIAVAPQSGTVG